jgi:transcriptional regulator with XRE-family HTH domain
MPVRSPVDRRLGKAIRALRTAKELTQEDLAHEARVTVATLARIERSTANPSWTTVRSVAGGLGVSLVELAAEVERYRE